MGRFERSERGGGQPDPSEALRRAREAVERERAQREEGPGGRERDEVEKAEEALRKHDARADEE
jgi:hypothetical protein